MKLEFAWVLPAPGHTASKEWWKSKSNCGPKIPTSLWLYVFIFNYRNWRKHRGKCLLSHTLIDRIFILRCSIFCASVTVSTKFCSCLVSRQVSAASCPPENLLYERKSVLESAKVPGIHKSSWKTFPLKDFPLERGSPLFPEKTDTLGVWAVKEEVMTEEESGLV